jgi:hypothetical protein
MINQSLHLCCQDYLPGIPAATHVYRSILALLFAVETNPPGHMLDGEEFAAMLKLSSQIVWGSHSMPDSRQLNAGPRALHRDSERTVSGIPQGSVEM